MRPHRRLPRKILFFLVPAVFSVVAGCRTVAPAPTTIPAASACPSGECMPAADLSGWKLIFSDDFTTPLALGSWSGCSDESLRCRSLPDAYRTKWWVYPSGWPDTSRNGRYDPVGTLSVSDGALDLFIHSQNGIHLVAAPVPLIHGNAGPLGQLYGRYAVRFRADSLPGYKIAWLLWPDSETWPRDGEIDFPEADLDGMITGFVHHQAGTAPDDQDGFSPGVSAAGGWHTAVIEWLANSVRFYLDGIRIGKSSQRIPNTPMHWVLQTETALGGLEPADGAAGHIRVDWVAVWAPR